VHLNIAELPLWIDIIGNLPGASARLRLSADGAAGPAYVLGDPMTGPGGDHGRVSVGEITGSQSPLDNEGGGWEGDDRV
jgi:hypothetical protein